MVYDMLDKADRGDACVRYCITLADSMFSDLHPTTDIHDIVSIGGRFYVDGREA